MKSKESGRFGKTTRPLVRCTLTAAAIVVVAAAAPAMGETPSRSPVVLDIPAQPLSDALSAFAQQSGLQIMFHADAGNKLTAPAVTGRVTPVAALERLLANTSLEFEFVDERTVAIREKKKEKTTDAGAARGDAQMRLAREDASPYTQSPEEKPKAANAAEKAGAAKLDEIVVTATKRQESVQDVSAGISVLTTADIQRQGLDDFESFVRTMPGITLNQQIRNRAVLNIRGISTSVIGGNTQDPVAVYINETPVTDTFGAQMQPDLRLFDVERIEVLRGPQGTLFGSGSLGGTVRVITKQPGTDRLEAAGRVDFGVTEGGFTRERYDAMVNVPLVQDQLAVRVVGYVRNEDGWVENIRTGAFNDTKDWGGRASLRWTPTAAFSANLGVIHQDSDPRDSDSWNPALGRYKKSAAIGEGRPAEFTNYSLNLEYAIADFANLVSASTYQTSDTGVFSDGGDAFLAGSALLSKFTPWTSKFFTQELRLVSNSSSKLEWVLGAFYIDRKTDSNFVLEYPGLDQLFFGLLPNDSLFESRIHTASEELAGFGNVSYLVGERWKVSGGLRVFKTKVDYSEPQRKTLSFTTFDFVTTSFANRGEATSSTWRAGLAYLPSADSQIYANVSKGFRIGQVNPNLGPSVVDPGDVVIPSTYDPDTTLNYEVGIKSAWQDGRIIANLAAYYIDWRDIQLNAVRTSDRLSFITNAGKAVSKGLELELRSRPTRALDLALSVALQDSEITQISAADSLRSGVAKGDELPGSVDLQLAGSVQYSWSAYANKEMYVRLDAQYVGSSLNGFSLQARTGLPSTTLATNEAYENVNLAVGLVADRWELAVYGENMTDNDSFILKNGFSTNSINTLRPRTGGIRFSYHY